MLSCDAGQRQQPQLQASPGMMRVNSRNSRVQWLHAFSTFRGITLMQPDCNLRSYDSNLCCLQKYHITLASDQRAYNLSPISSSYAIQRCLLFELPQQFSGPFLWYWTLCFFVFALDYIYWCTCLIASLDYELPEAGVCVWLQNHHCNPLPIVSIP